MEMQIGSNSRVILGDTPEHLKDRIHIRCGNNCIIEIQGLRANNNRLIITMNDDAVLRMGAGQLMNGVVSIMMLEKSTVTVGDGCLWSDCKIWSSDMHSIIDIDSGERINHAQDIDIGSNVWLGADAMVLKGARIADGCIIGARAVVTQSSPTESNAILAGAPAKIIRQNVKWDLQRIPRDQPVIA